MALSKHRRKHKKKVKAYRRRKAAENLAKKNHFKKILENLKSKTEAAKMAQDTTSGKVEVHPAFKEFEEAVKNTEEDG